MGHGGRSNTDLAQRDKKRAVDPDIGEQLETSKQTRPFQGELGFRSLLNLLNQKIL